MWKVRREFRKERESCPLHACGKTSETPMCAPRRLRLQPGRAWVGALETDVDRPGPGESTSTTSRTAAATCTRLFQDRPFTRLHRQGGGELQSSELASTRCRHL